MNTLCHCTTTDMRIWLLCTYMPAADGLTHCYKCVHSTTWVKPYLTLPINPPMTVSHKASLLQYQIYSKRQENVTPLFAALSKRNYYSRQYSLFTKNVLSYNLQQHQAHKYKHTIAHKPRNASSFSKSSRILSGYQWTILRPPRDSTRTMKHDKQVTRRRRCKIK